MFGTSTNLGIIPRAVAALFERMKELEDLGWKFRLVFSFFEIYNDNIYDLLALPSASSAGQREASSVRSINGSTAVIGLNEAPLTDAESSIQKIMDAMQHRVVAGTAGNAESSRGHAVGVIDVIGVNVRQHKQIKSVLHLGDLAGSERLSTSDPLGARKDETAAINSSLSTLKRVLEHASKTASEDASRAPYEDCK